MHSARPFYSPTTFPMVFTLGCQPSVWIKTSSLWVALSINTTRPALSNACLWHSDILKAPSQVSISAVTLGGRAAFHCDKWGPSGKTRLSTFIYRVRIWGVSVNNENGANMQLPGLDQPEIQGTAGILQIRRVRGTIRAPEQNIQSADIFSPLWATIICPNSH